MANVRLGLSSYFFFSHVKRTGQLRLVIFTDIVLYLFSLAVIPLPVSHGTPTPDLYVNYSILHTKSQ